MGLKLGLGYSLTEINLEYITGLELKVMWILQKRLFLWRQRQLSEIFTDLSSFHVQIYLNDGEVVKRLNGAWHLFCLQTNKNVQPII